MNTALILVIVVVLVFLVYFILNPPGKDTQGTDEDNSLTASSVAAALSD